MKKSITKKQIIKALETELHLERGKFFAPVMVYRSDKGYGSSRRIFKKDCPVCAVGSVLRAMSYETWAKRNKLDLTALGEYVTVEDYIGLHHKKLIKEKNYLGALSCYFEDHDGNRKKTIKFVRKYFPAVLTITVSKGSLPYERS